MKITHLMIPLCSVTLLSSCASFDAKKTDPAPVESHHKPLAIPIGHNWQIVEEAPKLSDQTGRLPFQREESVQPDGGKSAPPLDNRRIEIPR
jgi:hypothetical protein